jgi:hypothetical protein
LVDFAMLMNNPDLRTLQPVLARSTHTGRVDGEYCTPEFHDAAFAGLPIHGGAEALSYQVAPLDVLPTVVRRHAQLWYELTRALNALGQRSTKSGIADPAESPANMTREYSGRSARTFASLWRWLDHQKWQK